MFRTKLLDIQDLRAAGQAGISDLALLLGGDQDDVERDIRGRLTGKLLSATGCSYTTVHGINKRGTPILIDTYDGLPSLRLGLSPFPRLIKTQTARGYLDVSPRISVRKDRWDRWTFQYGTYPQQVTSGGFARTLEQRYQAMTLKTGPHLYSLNIADLHGLDDDRTVLSYHETYRFEKGFFLRITAQKSDKILSDGQHTRAGDPYWIEVSPITWIYDPKIKQAYTDMALVSGIQYQKDMGCCQLYVIRYDTSDVHAFLTKHFDDEIQYPRHITTYSRGKQPLPSSRERGI